MNRARLQLKAFSLVEILIVVMIVGILAAIAIPKFSNASQLARDNSIKDNLRLMRTQIGVYQSQHSLNPGYPNGDGTQTPTAQAASDQLLNFSDSIGNTSPTMSPVFKWGPYLTDLPLNSVNNRKDWKILADTDPFTPDDSTGWLYQPGSGTIKVNSSGNDSNGMPYSGY